MKKVLALLAIVGFVACNNAETPSTPVDSPAAPATVDTPAAAPATPDTTAAAPAAADTTKK